MSTKNLFVVLFFDAELDVETTITESWDCDDSKYCYQPAALIVIRDLKIITDSRLWSTICEEPKYRVSWPIDFKACREEIAGALQEVCNRWFKLEHVESML